MRYGAIVDRRFDSGFCYLAQAKQQHAIGIASLSGVSCTISTFNASSICGSMNMQDVAHISRTHALMH